MERQEAISRLLPLCRYANELAIDEALDSAVIRGQATVGGDFRVRWSQRDGFTFTPDPTGLHESMDEAAHAAAALPRLTRPPGSWPTDCLAVVGLNADGLSAVAFLYDNEPPDPLRVLPGPLLGPASAGKLADHAAGALTRDSVPAAILLRFNPGYGADPAVTAFRERLPPAGVRLAAVVGIRDSLCKCLCGDPRCSWIADLPTASDRRAVPAHGTSAAGAIVFRRAYRQAGPPELEAEPGI
jgi:hypothetical protein